MSVCAIMLVKDEADIIETTLRHLATQVDEIVVADNRSTDGTWEELEYLRDAGLPLLIEDDPVVGYYQSRKMTVLARDAGDRGHEWVVPCDADEIWYSTHGRVGDILGTLAVEVAEAVLYDHVATGSDPADDDPTVSIGWRRHERGGLPKVACRVRPGLAIEMGNHGAHYPGPTATLQEALTVRHFPYRSAEQMVSKVRNGAAAYAATNLPPDIGQHWREYGDLLEKAGEQAIFDVFRTWFWVEKPEQDGTLIYDPAPVARS